MSTFQKLYLIHSIGFLFNVWSPKCSVTDMTVFRHGNDRAKAIFATQINTLKNTLNVKNIQSEPILSDIWSIIYQKIPQNKI